MKKKIVAILLSACLALAPTLSSADELMDITRAVLVILKRQRPIVLNLLY